MTREQAEKEIRDNFTEVWADGIIKALEQKNITWIVGNDNVQIAVRNMPVDMMQKINAIISNKQETVLDKIREQMKDYLRGVEITLEVLVEGDPLRPKMEGAKDTLEECLELIDRAESEA